MKVSIDVNSGFRRMSVIANNSNGLFTANGNPVNADIDSFIFKVCDTILEWPTSLKSTNKKIHDGTTVVIYFEGPQNKKKFKFVNELPEDFYKLEILLDEVNQNVEKDLRQAR